MFLLANLIIVFFPWQTFAAEEPAAVPLSPATTITTLNLSYELDHYDEAGFPENRDGELILRPSPDGPVVPLSDTELALLYARFVNEQRDAVYLARTGDFSDTLPNGQEYVIPYGFGALKQNIVQVSLVEGELLPHFSDNKKKYTLFPLQDFFLGGALGLSGVTANFRYTYKEKYSAHLALGVNAWGALSPGSLFGSYRVPAHLGGGYRVPGLFPELLGDNSFTLGLDLFTGWGRPADSPDGPAVFCLPGIFLDFEKIFYQGTPQQQDFRQQPEPYNYGMNSFFVRLGVYLNTVDPGRHGLTVFDLSCGFLFSFKGPAIPAHKFKETRPVYTHALYQGEIARQKQAGEQINSSLLPLSPPAEVSTAGEPSAAGNGRFTGVNR